ncbi:MAG: adenine nucleotide alpha hydrolase [Candidatus Poribacteria bacterium]|nr:adenine nucleotide alpha hydrolase [Candidatus Poribacteria bacterium]MDE0503339.1 adenine nucleotide alpha hydrolase [Candidatus Poribacteria bacterium]
MTIEPRHGNPTPVLVSWSSGKDSAWTLYTLCKRPELYSVRGVFTTVTKTFDRVSIHSTPSWVLKQQAEKLGVPLYEIPIPYPCSNEQYESAMEAFFDRVKELPEGAGATHFAFGDLFLEDIRRYREEKLCGTGFTPIFPVWGRNTAALAHEMIDSGIRAIVTAINPTQVPEEFAGRWFDSDFLADLPEGVDPLGENGEFHTCVVDGPMFSAPIKAKPGRIVKRHIASASTGSDDEIHTGNSSPTYVYADVVPLT